MRARLVAAVLVTFATLAGAAPAVAEPMVPRQAVPLPDGALDGLFAAGAINIGILNASTACADGISVIAVDLTGGLLGDLPRKEVCLNLGSEDVDD